MTGSRFAASLLSLVTILILSVPAVAQWSADGTYHPSDPNYYGQQNQQHNAWAQQQWQYQQQQRQRNLDALGNQNSWGSQAMEQQLWQQQMLEEQRRANQYRWESLQQNQKPVPCGILPTHKYAREGC